MLMKVFENLTMFAEDPWKEDLIENIWCCKNDAVRFKSSPFSTQCSKTQKNFLNALRQRDAFKQANNMDMVFRNIRFSDTDSKTLVINSKGNIYDINPHWLKAFPIEYKSLEASIECVNIIEPCIVTRANLSFSHFVATDLAMLLIQHLFTDISIPLVTPWLTEWQEALLKLYKIKNRRIIVISDSRSYNRIFDIKCNSVSILEDLREYEGLTICRTHAQQQIWKRSKRTRSSIKTMIWIGRMVYEKRNGMEKRILNFERAKELISRYSMVYIEPSQMQFSVIVDIIQDADIIIAESGSLFINYLLFSRLGVPIIQLTPKGCLGPTWSYYNINNMQWFRPVINQIYFFEGRNPTEPPRKYGSPWNRPSVYDFKKLEQLILSLI
jgi:hypothetical protein